MGERHRHPSLAHGGQFLTKVNVHILHLAIPTLVVQEKLKKKKKCLQKTCKECPKPKARKSLGVHILGAGLPNGGISLVQYYSAGKTSALLTQHHSRGQEAHAERRCLTQHGSRHLRPRDQQDSAEMTVKAERCFRRRRGGL